MKPLNQCAHDTKTMTFYHLSTVEVLNLYVMNTIFKKLTKGLESSSKVQYEYRLYDNLMTIHENNF